MKFKHALLASAIVLPSLLASPVAAQTSGDIGPDAETTEQSTIVVTGSRIGRRELENPSPIQILDKRDVDAFGGTDIADLMVELPGVSYDISPQNSEASTQNSGLSSINLRNLGGNRTLTLIDGRRAVSNSANAVRVSTSTIAPGMVERIEVTTGGASAIYGSDAVAGVANIVLRNNFDGIDGEVRFEDSDEGGGRSYSTSVTVGKNINDRGNIILSGYWDQQSIIRGADRDFASQSVGFSNGIISPNLSSIIPGGRFEGNNAWFANGAWANIATLPPAGETTPRPFNTAIDGFNTRPTRTISPQTERFLVAAKFRYEFSPAAEFFLSGQYAFQETTSFREARTATNTTSFGPNDISQVGAIAATNPFIPPQVNAVRSGTVSFSRRFSELGDEERTSDRETVRIWAGLKGELASNWAYDVYYGYGRFTQDQTRSGAINLQNLRSGLNVSAIAGSPGQFQCNDPIARAAGCIPVNIFGENSLKPEMIAYIEARDVTNTSIQQNVFAASVVGELFQLPAGPVSIAAGVEYRKEQQTTDGDARTQSEVTTLAFIADLAGKFDVKEVFAEIDVPLLRDQPFAHSLGLDGAVRVANYGQENVGTVVSFKAGGHWAPSRDIRFRGQFSRAQRAPDITELFSTERADFDNLNDPCNGVTALTAGTVASNCRADPGVLNAINTLGVFNSAGTSIFGPNAGNLDLREETADTITLGVVLTPRFLPGFSATVDYYHIDINRAIGSIESQLVADLCYTSDTVTNNRFCSAITRDPLGQVTKIENKSENLNQIISSGIDATLAYKFKLPAIPGEFDSRLIYSHIGKLETRFDGPAGEVSIRSAGEVGNSRDQLRFTFGWTHDGFRIRYRMTHIGNAADDVNLAETSPAYFKVGDWQRHDIYAEYSFDTGAKFTLFGGVNNIGNDHGPFLPSGTNSGDIRNFNGAYDPIGRRFYGGLRVRY